MAGAQPARALFGARAMPAEMPPAAIGSYAKGCLAGAIRLPETGIAWQAMRLDRNRNWGHPALVSFIQRLGRAAQAIGWPGIYVGDLSQPRGGPMVSGHASHQIGLDADIWLRRPDRMDLSRAQRGEIGAPSVVTPDGLHVNGRWTRAHRLLLKAAAEDPAVARIFVNAAIKRKLCQAVPEGPGRAWLRKIRPWWGHREHFHVRLHCPASSEGCVEQAPPPAGDSCDETLAWWFTDEALHPGPSTPSAPLTMADLPSACRKVLHR